MSGSSKPGIRDTLKRLITLDQKLTDHFEIQKEWLRLQKDAEERPYDPPKLKGLWKTPFRAFLWTLIVFTGMMILFGITGLAFGHYVFSYTMFIPLALKALVFSKFGNVWPLPDTVTPEHVRSWLSGIDYAPERYEIFAHCLVGILLLSVLVFIIVFIVNLIVRLISWRKEKALYPPTEEAFREAELQRSGAAKEAFLSYEEMHGEVLQELFRNQEEFEKLSESIGLPLSYRFRGYLKAFSEYAAEGRIETIQEAILLHQKETVRAEKARLKKEAEENSVQRNAARAEFQKRRAQFNVDPSTFSGKIHSELTSF